MMAIVPTARIPFGIVKKPPVDPEYRDECQDKCHATGEFTIPLATKNKNRENSRRRHLNCRILDWNLCIALSALPSVDRRAYDGHQVSPSEPRTTGRTKRTMVDYRNASGHPIHARTEEAADGKTDYEEQENEDDHCIDVT